MFENRNPMIELKNLTYSYRKNVNAVDDVSATIGNGIYLLLGENGAGKTTLLNLMAGLLIPRKGSVVIDGMNPSLHQPETMEKIFCLGDTFDSPFATINELARYHSVFYPGFSREMFADNLKAFGLTGNEKFKNLSLGFRHKSILSYTLALGVDALLLDEPANGLDINSKKELKRMLGRCVGEKQTVIISTHTVSDLQPLFDGVLLLNRGKLTVSMSTYEITSCLQFVTSPVPVAGAIYQEPEAGLFRAIIENIDGEESEMNYELFYSAFMSDARGAVIDALNKRK